MAVLLQKLAEEDPHFDLLPNQETGETVIAGMGEVHLDIIVDRMRSWRVQSEANVGYLLKYLTDETFRASTQAEE